MSDPYWAEIAKAAERSQAEEARKMASFSAKHPKRKRKSRRRKA